VFNNYDSTESIISAFREQFALYICQEPPFIHTNKVEPLAYWKSLIAVGEASVLAVGVPFVTRAFTYAHPSLAGSGCQVLIRCSGSRMFQQC
jgi:hypothetical protein